MITVIGGGLAGSEAAWQVAESGLDVTLYEMRPVRPTPAHHTDRLAELVCSNSLGSKLPTVASGQLKNEMRLLGSLILSAAEASQVPAGGALGVDRDVFAQTVTDRISRHPRITLVRDEIKSVPQDGPTIIATGPLTSPELSASIRDITGQSHLYFFDAASPIVEKESLDLSKIFAQSRYDKGDGEYLNCPMDKDEYEAFWHALVEAEVAEVKAFDNVEANAQFFEGCLPVEVIGKRGMDTLRFGPLKPVGLTDPRTGKRPYAVVQLRQDNVAGTLYNLVGFQTQLKWGEQKRVFQMIPGLEQAEFVRMGVMHRNTYLDSPRVLLPTLQMKARPDVWVAGQLTGVEGYTESSAMGLLAGLNAARTAKGQDVLVPPPTTMLGALIRYITQAEKLQPINSNWGILEPLGTPIRDKAERHRRQCEIAMRDLAALVAEKALQ